jgi:hypothetical protein
MAACITLLGLVGIPAWTLCMDAAALRRISQGLHASACSFPTLFASKDGADKAAVCLRQAGVRSRQGCGTWP